MMSLMSPAPCVSDTFYFYRVSCFQIFCICSHWMNYILSMMSLTTMGLTLGPPVRSIFPLFDDYVVIVCGLGSGVFVTTGVESKCDIFVFVVFVPIGVKSKGGRIVKTI